MLRSNNYPFILIFPSLALGMFLKKYFPLAEKYQKLIIGLLAIFLIVWMVLEYKGGKGTRICFFSIIIGFGYLLAIYAHPYTIYTDFSVELTGRVISQRQLNYYQRLIIKSKEVGRYLAVHLPKDELVLPGMTLAFTGKIEKPEGARNPGEFSYISYLNSLNVHGILVPESYQILSEYGGKANGIAGLRNYVSSNLRQHITKPDLALALVLGEKEALSDAQKKLWQRLGISHLLAISGTHIGLLAGAFLPLASMLPGPRFIKKLIVGIFLLLYVLLSGSSPSAWRALLASIVGIIGTDNRHIEGLHVWSLVGTLMLLAVPNLVWQVGFQLSFIASGGIILWAPIIDKVTRRLPKNLFGKASKIIIASLTVSLAAQLALAPLLVYYFSEISILAPISTFLVLPFVISILIGGLAIGLLGPLVAPLGHVVMVLTKAVEFLGDWLSSCAYIIDSSPWSIEWLLVWYGCFIMIGVRGRKRFLFIGKQTLVRLSVFVLCLILIVSLPFSLRKPLEIVFLDVGQGDAIYIRTPYNQHILIDGGGDSPYWQLRGRNVGLTTLVPFLKYKGVKKLDLVILSHPHEDHLHGLLAVLEEFQVDLVIDGGLTHTTNTYFNYISLIEEKQIPYKIVQAGDKVILPGGVKLEIWHPSFSFTKTNKDLNNNSLVINLTYQGKSFLFTGDIDFDGIGEVCRSGFIKPVDLLKVPHHGSKSALLPKFYELLSPKYAVISVGGSNSFGHPDQAVINSLKEYGVKDIWRTDKEGAISLYIWNSILGRDYLL